MLALVADAGRCPNPVDLLAVAAAERQRQHVVARDLNRGSRLLRGLLEAVSDATLQGAVRSVDALDLPRKRLEVRARGF